MEKNRKYFWFVNNPEYHYREMGLLSVSFGRFLTNFLTVGRLASAGKKRSILSDCAHIHKTIVKVFVQRDFYCNRRAAMVDTVMYLSLGGSFEFCIIWQYRLWSFQGIQKSLCKETFIAIGATRWWRARHTVMYLSLGGSFAW